MENCKGIDNFQFIIQLFAIKPNTALESFRRGHLRTRILLYKTDRLPVKRRKRDMLAARPHSFVLARFKLEVGREKYEQTGDGGVYSRYISKL